MILLAVERRDNGDVLSAATSTPTASTAPSPAPVAPVDLVAVDPATLRGLTEAEARTVLTAAGLTATTTAGASPADVAGLVIDVQPNGQIAKGSNVTLILGDGTAVAAVTDPPSQDSNNGPSNGQGKGKEKRKGND